MLLVYSGPLSPHGEEIVNRRHGNRSLQGAYSKAVHSFVTMRGQPVGHQSIAPEKYIRIHDKLPVIELVARLKHRIPMPMRGSPLNSKIPRIDIGPRRHHPKQADRQATHSPLQPEPSHRHSDNPQFPDHPLLSFFIRNFFRLPHNPSLPEISQRTLQNSD